MTLQIITRRFSTGLIAVAVLGLFAAVGWRLSMPGALFLSRFMGAPSETVFADLSVTDAEIHHRGRKLPCHVYRPADGYDKVLLVVHGVHHGGYDEPRMVRFAKELARLGHLVITPDIEDMKNYDISRRAVDDIHGAAKWIIDASGFVGPEGRISILGFSFAGGLAISAAARPDIRDRVSAVFSFGGHADLDRVMRYLTTGKLPTGGMLEPHVYGQAVIARRFAQRLVRKSSPLSSYRRSQESVRI